MRNKSTSNHPEDFLKKTQNNFHTSVRIVTFTRDSSAKYTPHHLRKQTLFRNNRSSALPPLSQTRVKHTVSNYTMTSLTISVPLASNTSEQLTPEPCLELRGEGLCEWPGVACAYTPSEVSQRTPTGPSCGAHTMERMIPFGG